MIKLSELQALEIVAIEDGRRLGHLQDLEIDPDSGKIIALVVMETAGGGSGFFKKQEEMLLYWRQILTIGADVILVKTANG